MRFAAGFASLGRSFCCYSTLFSVACGALLRTRLARGGTFGWYTARSRELEWEEGRVEEGELWPLAWHVLWFLAWQGCSAIAACVFGRELTLAESRKLC